MQIINRGGTLCTQNSTLEGVVNVTGRLAGLSPPRRK